MYAIMPNEPTIYYSLLRAEREAEILTDTDLDGWTYRAKKCTGSEKAKIFVYDENNEFMGWM